jgi:AcrR family transcriptional regulator
VAVAPDPGSHARTAIVDATIELADTQEYARLGVGEIAAAAGVEASEFFRCFADKDAVVMSILHDMLAAAAAYLPASAYDDPRHALHAANAAMLQDIIDGRGPVSMAHLTGMVAVVTRHPPLQKRASALRQQVMSQALADQMGVEPGDQRVRRAVVAWSAVVAASYHADLGRSRSSVVTRSSHDRLAPERMSQRLDATFRRILGRAPSVGTAR